MLLMSRTIERTPFMWEKGRGDKCCLFILFFILFIYLFCHTTNIMKTVKEKIERMDLTIARRSKGSYEARTRELPATGETSTRG